MDRPDQVNPAGHILPELVLPVPIYRVDADSLVGHVSQNPHFFPGRIVDGHGVGSRVAKGRLDEKHRKIPAGGIAVAGDGEMGPAVRVQSGGIRRGRGKGPGKRDGWGGGNRWRAPSSNLAVCAEDATGRPRTWMFLSRSAARHAARADDLFLLVSAATAAVRRSGANRRVDRDSAGAAC